MLIPPANNSSDASNGQKPKKLLDQLRDEIRLRHYSIRTEQAYADWNRRFILFHNKRHPREMGAGEITAFLTHLAAEMHVSASTQNQALNAIVFLYKHVIKMDPGQFTGVQRAQDRQRRPVVLTRDEAHKIISGMSGTPKLVTALLYGSGLRLLEGLRLRVKDIDFSRNEIHVKDGRETKTVSP